MWALEDWCYHSDVTPCILVYRHYRFAATCCLHFHLSTPIMKTAVSSVTLTLSYQTSRRNSPQEWDVMTCVFRNYTIIFLLLQFRVILQLTIYFRFSFSESVLVNSWVKWYCWNLHYISDIFHGILLNNRTLFSSFKRHRRYSHDFNTQTHQRAFSNVLALHRMPLFISHTNIWPTILFRSTNSLHASL
jgi:hypothetical protein